MSLLLLVGSVACQEFIHPGTRSRKQRSWIRDYRLSHETSNIIQYNATVFLEHLKPSIAKTKSYLKALYIVQCTLYIIRIKFEKVEFLVWF